MLKVSLPCVLPSLLALAELLDDLLTCLALVDFDALCPDLFSLVAAWLSLGRSTDEFLADEDREDMLAFSLSPLGLLNQCLFRDFDEIDGVGLLTALVLGASG